MSYKDLWNNAAAVLKQSEIHQQIFQDFIASIADRIDVEENYGYQLTQLSDKLNKHLQKNKEDSPVLIVLSGLKSDLLRRGNETMKFVDHLKSEVLKNLKQLHQKQVPKAIQASAQMRVNEIQHQNQYTRVKLKNPTQGFNLEIVKARFYVNVEEEQKQSFKVRKAEKQYLEAETIAKTIVKQYNDAITRLYEGLDKNLSLFEEQQKRRIDIMMDSMMKILTFQVSMTRNFQYDVNTIMKHLEKIQVNKTIQNFVETETKKIQKYPNQSLPKLSLMDSVLLGMIKKTLDEKIKFNNNDKIQKMVINFSKNLHVQDVTQYPDFPFIYKTLRQALKAGIKPEHETKFNQLLDNIDNRNFLQLLIKEITPELELNIKNLASVVQYFINKCFIKKDVFNIRPIVKLIFQNTNPKYLKQKDGILYGNLSHISLWKNHAFWQAFTFESIQEQLKVQQAFKGEGKQQSKLREQKIILTQLSSCCYSMIMLGHSIGKTKQLALKYGQFYSLEQKSFLAVQQSFNQAATLHNNIWQSIQKTASTSSTVSK